MQTWYAKLRYFFVFILFQIVLLLLLIYMLHPEHQGFIFYITRHNQSSIFLEKKGITWHDTEMHIIKMDTVRL